MKIKSDVIRRALVDRELTFRDLEHKSGIASNTVSRILKKGACSPVNAGRIARGLGVDIDEIAEWEGGGQDG